MCWVRQRCGSVTPDCRGLCSAGPLGSGRCKPYYRARDLPCALSYSTGQRRQSTFQIINSRVTIKIIPAFVLNNLFKAAGSLKHACNVVNRSKWRPGVQAQLQLFFLLCVCVCQLTHGCGQSVMSVVSRGLRSLIRRKCNDLMR